MKKAKTAGSKSKAPASHPYSMPANTSNSSRKVRQTATRRARTTKKSERRGVASKRFANIHQMQISKHWQAWTPCISTDKSSRGPYTGEHWTENLAARAQDRALLKLRDSATKPIKLNFPESDYSEDEALRKFLTEEEFLQLLAREARTFYGRVGPTRCLQKFVAEEIALGNLQGIPENNYKIKPLKDHLETILRNRVGAGQGGHDLRRRTPSDVIDPKLIHVCRVRLRQLGSAD